MSKFKWLVFGLLLLLVLSGCGNGNESNQSSGDSDEKTIEMWTREPNRLVMENALESFNEEDNGFNVEVVYFPNDNFNEKFSAAVSSGAVPDLVTIDLVFAPYFSSIGAFEDITDYYDSLDFKEELVDSMVNQGSFDDNQYLLPLNGDVSALVYNKEHFEEAGLDPESPPETWDELREYSNKLTNDDHYGYVHGGANLSSLTFTFLPYIWGNGGDVLNEDQTESVINSPEAIEALQYYVDLSQKDEVVPEGVSNYGWNEAQDAFTSGSASMWISGSYVIGVMKEDHPDMDYGVSLIPKNDGKNHSSMAGGDLIGIPTGAENIDEAEEVIDYLLSEAGQGEHIPAEGFVPVRSDMMDNEYFLEEEKYQVFAESMEVGKTPYTVKYTEIYNDILLSETQRAINGEITAEEAFENAENEINNLLQ